MLDSSGGAQVLKLANINTVEHGEPVQRFRVYFARSLPDESAMVVVQAAFRDGYIQESMPAASNIRPPWPMPGAVRRASHNDRPGGRFAVIESLEFNGSSRAVLIGDPQRLVRAQLPALGALDEHVGVF